MIETAIEVTEQRVPASDRVDLHTGSLEEARLDFAICDPADGRPVFIDWSAIYERSIYAPRKSARSNTDGLAASQMVDAKRAR